MTYRPIPRDELLEVLRWLAVEVYTPAGEAWRAPRLVDHPLDDEGIAVWLADVYVRYRQDGIAHEDATHLVYADIDRVVHPPPAPPPPPPVPPPAPWRRLAGLLRLEAGAYVDEAGPILPVYCHAGDVLARLARGEGTQVEQILTVIAAAGYHGVRTWTVLEGAYWQGMEVGPWMAHYRDLLVRFCALLRARELRWQVSQGDLWHLGAGAREDVRAALLDALTPDILASIDGANEAANNGCPDPQEIVRWLTPLTHRFPHAVVSLSSYPEEATPDAHAATVQAWTQHPATIVDHHLARPDDVGNIRVQFNAGYERAPGVPSLGAASEPRGPGQRVSGHRVTDVHVLQQMAVAAAMSGQSYTYVCGPGVRSDEPEQFVDMPGFREVPALIHALPQDCHRWLRCHGGRRWVSARVYAVVPDGSPTVRADQAIAPDGRFLAHVYGDGWPACVTERRHVIELQRDFGTHGRLLIGRLQ